MSKPKTTAQNLESRFEAGEDVLDYFDTAKAVRRNHAKARINLDLPAWMIQCQVPPTASAVSPCGENR